MKVKDITLSATELGAVLGISGRRVLQLAGEGVFERAGRGQFPLVANVRAFVAEIKSNSESDELQKERLALLRARRRRIELGNERVEGSERELAAQDAAVSAALMLIMLRLRPAGTWLHAEMKGRSDLAHAAVEMGSTVTGWITAARSEIEAEILGVLSEARRKGVLIVDFAELMRLLGHPVDDGEGEPETTEGAAA